MTSTRQRLTALLGVLALIAMAFAGSHLHAPPASSQAQVDLSAYALPGGYIPELCVVGDDPSPDTAAAHCPLCCHMPVPGLAAAPEAWIAAPAIAASVAYVAVADLHEAPAAHHRQRARAPPA